MKKIILTIAFVLTFGLGVNAQIGLGDAFINNWDNSDVLRDEGFNMSFLSLSSIPGLPGLPDGHGSGGDINLPLGSGLFILGALGAGYAVAKRRRK